MTEHCACALVVHGGQRITYYLKLFWTLLPGQVSADLEISPGPIPHWLTPKVFLEAYFNFGEEPKHGLAQIQDWVLVPSSMREQNTVTNGVVARLGECLPGMHKA